MVFDEVQKVVSHTSRISSSRLTTGPARDIRACSSSNSLRESPISRSPRQTRREAGSRRTSWTVSTRKP